MQRGLTVQRVITVRMRMLPQAFLFALFKGNKANQTLDMEKANIDGNMWTRSDARFDGDSSITNGLVYVPGPATDPKVVTGLLASEWKAIREPYPSASLARPARPGRGRRNRRFAGRELQGSLGDLAI